MDNRPNRQGIEPLCRFGPGGDFISDWSPDLLRVLPQPSSSGLRKLLTLLREITTAVLGSKLNAPSGVAPSVYRLTDQFLAEEEKLKHGVKDSQAEKRTYAATVPIVESNRRFRSEPMLFADDWGAGVRTGRKPKHHIRAYRRTAKKRHTFSLPGQGSLFETDFKSVRTA